MIKTLQEAESPMASINPYINFNGNAVEAFTFYKSVFGGELGTIVRFIKKLLDDPLKMRDFKTDTLRITDDH